MNRRGVRLSRRVEGYRNMAAGASRETGGPGSISVGYQVSFRVPPDIAKGPAIVQVSAAWIPGAPVTIPVP